MSLNDILADLDEPPSNLECQIAEQEIKDQQEQLRQTNLKSFIEEKKSGQSFSFAEDQEEDDESERKEKRRSQSARQSKQRLLLYDLDANESSSLNFLESSDE